VSFSEFFSNLFRIHEEEYGLNKFFDSVFRGKKTPVLTWFEKSPTASASLAIALCGEVWLGSRLLARRSAVGTRS
jgi:hypothetical protein